MMCVKVVAPDIKHYEEVSKFKLLLDPFSVDNGLLTPKMSQKRNIIEERYSEAIEALHAV